MAEFRHGHRKLNSTTYRSWRNMRARCSNPNSHDYPHYGGRGIRICGRWDRFQAFLADMGERPEGFTLERKDNNGNYTPDNCKWATPKEQAQNRSDNRILEHCGERKTLNAWAEANGMTLATLRQRLLKEWPLELALSQPVQQSTKLTPAKVRTIRTSGRRASDLAAEYDVSRSAVFRAKRRETWKRVQ